MRRASRGRVDELGAAGWEFGCELCCDAWAEAAVWVCCTACEGFDGFWEGGADVAVTPFVCGWLEAIVEIALRRANPGCEVLRGGVQLESGAWSLTNDALPV